MIPTERLIEDPANYVKQKYLDYLNKDFHATIIKYAVYQDRFMFGVRQPGSHQNRNILIDKKDIIVNIWRYAIHFKEQEIRKVLKKRGYMYMQVDLNYLLPDIQKKVLKAIL